MARETPKSGYPRIVFSSGRSPDLSRPVSDGDRSKVACDSRRDCGPHGCGSTEVVRGVLEGADGGREREMKRRSSDKYRCWYALLSVVVIVGMIAFQIFRKLA